MNKGFLLTTAAVAIATAAMSNQAKAQTDPQLEELVVTAQKREQSLQDVPISIVALSGNRIADAGIQQLEEMSALVPNFSIQKDPIGDKINIRGVQSGNNAGLEQSVSTFVDGVYRGRGIQSRFSFLDPGIVEVLRGPQGTLFGKNTIGGAINITTARPTDEFEGLINATYTFDGIDAWEVRGHLSGPLSDNTRGRLVFMSKEMNEGWVFNEFYDQYEPGGDEQAIRATIESDLSDATTITAKIEHGTWDQVGQPLSTLTAGPLSVFGVQEGNFERALIGSRNPVLDLGAAGLFEGETSEAMLNVTHELNNGTLTAIAAYSAYDFARKCDCDFSVADIARFDDEEDFDQTSLEVRYASDNQGPFNYIVGGYYHNNDLNVIGDAQFNARGVPGELALDTLLGAGCSAAVAAGANPVTNRSCLLNGLVTAFDGTPLAYSDFGRLHTLDQESTVYALFTQLDWTVSERSTLGLGLRYTIEDKNAVQSAIATDYGTRNRNDFYGTSALWAQFGAPDPFSALGEAEIHSNNLEREEKSLTGSLIWQFALNESSNLYARAATGFKAGGFNSFALSSDPAEAEFEEEEVTSYELGGKFSLLDNAAEINVALFHSEFDDLQTALFTGSTSFIVQNAAQATSSGVEVDGRWAVSEAIMVYGSMAYVDFSFDSFPNAGCTVDQLLAFRVSTTNPLATLQTCAAAEVNDLTGRTSENTPEISAALGFRGDWGIGDNLQLYTSWDLIYSDEQFRQADLDPAILDDSFVKVNAMVGISSNEDTWAVDLLVKNLTDEDTYSYGNDTPLIDTGRQFAPDQPRTVAVRLTYRF